MSFHNLFNKENKLTYHEAHLNDYISHVDEGDMSYLTFIFCALTGSDSATKIKAAKKLHQVISNMDDYEIIKIDKMFRQKTSMEWSIDWRNLDPKSLLSSRMIEDEKIAVLEFGTFNPNGYFREKSINMLSNIGNGKELGFIALRLNDWVGQIRLVAKRVLLEKINKYDADSIIEALPYIDVLKYKSRSDYKDIFDTLFQKLLKKDNLHTLMKSAISDDYRIRRISYEIMLLSENINNETFINILGKEKIPSLRLSIIDTITPRLSQEECMNFLPVLLKDAYPAIRDKAMLLYHEIYKENAVPTLKKMIFDANSWVRYNARFLLDKYIEVDYRIEYINGLNRENIIGAISGLSETGKEEDSLIVEEYLNSQKIKVVKIAMRTLIKLNQKKYLVRMIDLLVDSRIGISKDARKLLIGCSYALYEKEIHQLFSNTEIFHVRYNCAVLLGNLSKWNSIKYIIELMDDNDEHISTYGKIMFDAWQNKFNKSFTSPTKSQICDIKDIINEKMHVLSKEKARFIEFILDKY